MTSNLSGIQWWLFQEQFICSTIVNSKPRIFDKVHAPHDADNRACIVSLVISSIFYPITHFNNESSIGDSKIAF